MKIAIHPNTNSFSERWIKYCEEKNIDYKIVNAFDTNIIEQLKDCDIFMWHHHHAQYKDVLTAKRILFALEHAGVKVFPDFKTGWHFDDKVAQKYLLEAINAPLVPSYVFYDKETALNWAKNTSYPKVFKLKGGAGASNVKLVKNYSQAASLVKQAFSQGFSQFDRVGNFKERYKKIKSGDGNLLDLIKGIYRFFRKTEFSKKYPNEKGYVYFQDFIPDNDSDIRVIVVGDKAFAIKRLIRNNDFRASGSGKILYSPKVIDIKCIDIAFNVNSKLESKCVAFDFVISEDNEPLVVEISYGFSVEAYDECSGYWTKDLTWNKKEFKPQNWMIENILNS